MWAGTVEFDRSRSTRTGVARISVYTCHLSCDLWATSLPRPTWVDGFEGKPERENCSIEHLLHARRFTRMVSLSISLQNRDYCPNFRGKQKVSNIFVGLAQSATAGGGVGLSATKLKLFLVLLHCLPTRWPSYVRWRLKGPFSITG